MLHTQRATFIQNPMKPVDSTAVTMATGATIAAFLTSSDKSLRKNKGHTWRSREDIVTWILTRGTIIIRPAHVDIRYANKIEWVTEIAYMTH